MAVSEKLIRNCIFGVRCSKHWDDLSKTKFHNVRHCDACNSPVHHCADDAQLRYAIEQNWCVSITSVATEGGEDIECQTTGFIENIEPEDKSYQTFAELAKSNMHFSSPPASYRKGNWEDQSPLHLLGYRVGRKGQSKKERESLLIAFYAARLPLEYPVEYMEKWGEPASHARKHAMIQHLRWLATRAAAREDADSFTVAINHWDDDADFIESSLFPTL